MYKLLLNAVTSSGILLVKQKLGRTFSFDKLDIIDFTKLQNYGFELNLILKFNVKNQPNHFRIINAFLRYCQWRVIWKSPETLHGVFPDIFFRDPETRRISGGFRRVSGRVSSIQTFLIDSLVSISDYDKKFNKY